MSQIFYFLFENYEDTFFGLIIVVVTKSNNFEFVQPLETNNDESFMPKVSKK